MKFIAIQGQTAGEAAWTITMFSLSLVATAVFGYYLFTQPPLLFNAEQEARVRANAAEEYAVLQDRYAQAFEQRRAAAQALAAARNAGDQAAAERLADEFRAREQEVTAVRNDALALALAQEAVARGCDRELPVPQRAFLYLPYMHSESPLIHEQALRLYATPGLEHNLDFERRHKAIIDRFGRYPHRNALLGRVSTPEELEFLQQPGSSF